MLLRGDETNPILHIEELARFSWRRPPPVPGAVHVYLSRYDRVLQPAGGFTIGELWLLGPRRLYVVDVAAHNDERTIEVPSPSSGGRAELALSYVWQVRDPRFVVESHLVDVMPVIQSLLRERVQTAVTELARDEPTELAAALGPGPFDRDGIEISSLTAEVFIADDGASAGRGDDG